ncbi:MAG: hypothetical protein HQL22_12745 [Candidatus Omnitrophica bacterium]|nr:hypothetical protein [Candidatus Omnitrophota bacterium]
MKDKTEKDLPIYEVLKNIKDGTTNPDLIPKETREQCVEVLFSEGYTRGQIASLLKKSDRTIRRDMAEFRKQNKIFASPELAQIIAGELLAMGRIQFARLKQLARSSELSGKDKAKVEYMSWSILKDIADKLHKFGFLPLDTKPALSSNDKAEKKKNKIDDSGISQEVINQINMLSPLESDQLRVNIERRIFEALEENPELKEEYEKGQ